MYKLFQTMFKIFFVRFAVGLLIVVDSSIPIKALPTNMLRKLRAQSTPFCVENASTFIINNLRSGVSSKKPTASKAAPPAGASTVVASGPPRNVGEMTEVLANIERMHFLLKKLKVLREHLIVTF